MASDLARSPLHKRAQVLSGGLTLAVMLSACAPAPQQVPIPAENGGFKPRQEVEIWRGSKATTLHRVQVRSDSLMGVPLWRPPECDSCRVVMPLREIDSLRTVSTERSWMLLASVPFVALGVVAATWALTEGD
jgi:hypothetical protein